MTFQKGGTIICSVEVSNSTGALVDPNSDYTHMKITIKDDSGGTMVDNTAMTRDSTGLYHYDFQTNSASIKRGTFFVQYDATDGTRISSVKDTFRIE